MKHNARLVLVALLLTAAVPSWAGEVKVTFSNGLVTIVATDASPRQILAEWAKLGQVRITNLERLAGSPLTLQLTNVPEAQALETLLRGTAGYVAAPRLPAATVASVSVSRYDRILLMPGAAPALPAAASASQASQPSGNRGRVNLPVFDAADDDTADPPRMMMPGPNQGPQGQRRGMSTPGQATPGQLAPGGMTTPGLVFVPGQTVAPGQSVSPGQFTATPASPYSPATIYGGAPADQQGTSPAAQQGMPGSAGRQVTTYPNPRLPAGATAAAPGMPTSPMQIPTAPYSNTGPPLQPDDPASPATMPGQSPVSATRPGEVTAPAPGPFRNPYGLPEPVRPPVTDPNANPYGLPNTVKPAAPGATGTTPGATAPGATTPGTTTPPGPIKDPAEEG